MTDATCRTLAERLDDLLEGRMTPDERRAALAHLASCAACAELGSLLERAAAPVLPPDDLLGAVMRRTSGSACDSARARLCDHVDGLLAPVDEGLVRMHLDACPECSGLGAVLARLAAGLPSLAEREPGAALLPAVLARTTRRATLAERVARSVAAACVRIGRRPQIAWEGAYVGSIILLLLFGVPSAPFAGVPERALGLVRSAREALPAETARRQVPRIRAAVSARWQETRTEIRGTARDVATDFERRSSTTWDRLKQKLGTLWDRIASQQTTDDTHKGDR
jgi:anti-sigma factor RsiW